jgi:FkbM family methyltransferase
MRKSWYLGDSVNFDIDRYENLRYLGYTPNRVLDIGAHFGEWASIIQNVYPDSEVVSIEGNPDCEVELQKRSSNYLITLLGDKNEYKHFYLPENDPTCTGGSYYKEQTHFYDNYTTKKLSSRTLDSLNLGHFNFIKIDVQGAELDIIKGGLKTILECDFLQLEVSMLRYNQNAPLVSQLVSYLYSLDFYMYDIASLIYLEGWKLNQTDLIFINNRKLPNFLNI